MEVTVARALTKIATDCPRKLGALKKQCRETLANIHQESEARSEGEPPDTDGNKYMPCLLAACSSGVPKVVMTGLDAIVKLMDYGYIRDVEVESDDEDEDDDEAEGREGHNGTVDPQPGVEEADPDGEDSTQARVEDTVETETAAGSGEGEAISAPSRDARSTSSALYIASTARKNLGAGSQPRFAPQRMFMDEVVERICDCDLETDGVQLQVIKALVHACTHSTLTVHQASLLTAVKTIYTVHLSTHDPINKNTAKASLQQMLSVVFVRMEAKDKQLKEEAAAAAELEALRKSDPVNYPPPPPVEPEPEPQPEPLPDPTFLIPESIYAEVAHAVQLPELYATVPELSTEEYLARRKRYRRALRGYRRRQWEANTVQPFPSVEHEDAFLLFRALCKLSQRPDHAGSGDGLAVAPTAEEARQMESKAVSLEMLLTIVENSGPGFRGSEKFILAVRHYLCEALLLNSTSSNRTVMKLSLKIFKPMCRDFKAHLKSQIEVCITTVFLRVLESENSTFEHKLQVLDVVTTFIDTPESLLEIFLNYDCDLHAIDLYNRIVNALSKISKGRGMSNADLANNPGLLREESYLRQRGLEGLVNILENLLRCVGTFVSAELHQQGELLDANGQPAEDAASGREASPETNRLVASDVNGSQGDTLPPSRSDKAEVDLKSPVSVVQEYDRKKKLAGDLGNGFVRFKLSPAKGIAYLVEKGMLQYDPRAVATFLLENCDKLDKTQIGEYLGKEIQYKDGFCVQVLHEYVDMMDFKGMRFDDAIRHYLSGFRLPGEAQKIDRMMEKFSERYCLQNPTVFPSADTAFILAFSIIMLNTDLHNPAIKEERKMTREGFATNNRGIAAGGNLEESFLNEIFDHIRANPISLKEDDTAREKAGEVAASAFPLYFTTGPSVRQKREAFNKEREDIIKNTEALFRLRKKQASAAKAQIIAKTTRKTAASSNGDGDGGEAKLAGTPPPKVAVALRAESASEGRRDVVRAMFEVAWWPMLGAFSQVLEDVDHPERADGITDEQEAVERDMVTFCIKGCRFGIRLGGLCSRWSGGEGEGAIARETFVNSLAKFTLLDTVKEMRPKSIDCVMALLDIALEDGNFLAESWGLVLRYISQLARLQLFASGLHTDDHFFTSVDDAASASASTGVPSSVGGGIGFTSASLHSVRLGSEAGSVVSRKPSKVGGLFGRVNPTEQARDVERMNAEAVSMAVDPTTIDRVFSNSRNLSTDAIKHFVTQLCAVSNQEVNHSAATFRSKDILGDMSQPRIFSLQKLVEVADFNMDSRGRIVWANIWGVLSQHFSELGAHPNRFVAEYSVDSLKQLALKFVYKEELRDFNFQRLFLCPFESIFVATQHKDIKALVLDCVQNLVQARSAHIRSGWKSILSVVALAAKEKTHGPALPRQAWEIVRRLVDEDMGSLVYDFLDVTKCLVGFLEGSDTDLSLQSLEKLKVCANHLGNGDLNILPPALHGHISTGTSTGTGTGVSPGAVILTGSIQRTTASDDVATGSEIDNNSNNKAENAAHELAYLQLWWPLLFGLSESMGDSRPTVRSYALETISAILDKHGSIFSPQTWGLLFRGVVSPVFENAITDTTRPLSSAWPGQEEDPREVAAAAAKAAEEEAAMMAAQREAEEKEKKARKAAASAWTRFPFTALRAAPAPESPPRYPRNRPSASAQRAAAFETGWTVTMAEPLLDMCFAVFFRHGEATLPLLPEILALHQRCICQESEVLARIALRSLGRFVTTMHKSFPAASATIIRRQAVSREGEGGVMGKGELEEEGKEEEYTVWDCLTSSLCAIMHDNLPLELLNNPFHIAPETSPFANTVDTDTSISPGWAQSGKLSQEHNDDNSKDTTKAAAATAGAAAAAPQAESESSWGELQDAGDPDNASGDESDKDSADSADGGDTAEAANAVNADDDGDTADTTNGNKHEAVMAEPEVMAAVDNTVGGDVVMVSPRDRVSVSENGLGDWVAEPGGAGEGRRPNLRALMTMLVVSLRMQRLVHWVVRKRCLDGLTEENLMDLLAALEAASVTALQFNRHHNLRRALGRVGFMTRGQPVPLCPMLEQEVAGYNLLLRTLVVLSCGMDVDTGEPVEGGAGWPFAQERLVQACKCVVLAYADREEHAMGVELSLPGLDHSALVEEVKETTALATLALRSMMHICEEQVFPGIVAGSLSGRSELRKTFSSRRGRKV